MTKRFWQIILVTMSVIFFALWAGNWFWGKAVARANLVNILADMGVVYEDMVLKGFPNRYDFTLVDARWHIRGLDMRVDILEIMRTAYDADHVIVALPEGVEFDGINGEVQLDGEVFRVSVGAGGEQIIAELKSARLLGARPVDVDHLIIAYDGARGADRFALRYENLRQTLPPRTGQFSTGDGELLWQGFRDLLAGDPLPDYLQ